MALLWSGRGITGESLRDLKTDIEQVSSDRFTQTSQYSYSCRAWWARWVYTGQCVLADGQVAILQKCRLLKDLQVPATRSCCHRVRVFSRSTLQSSRTARSSTAMCWIYRAAVFRSSARLWVLTDSSQVALLRRAATSRHKNKATARARLWQPRWM